jgi:hypothetical protein
MSLLTGVGGLILLLLAIGGAIALDSPDLGEARAAGRMSWIVVVGVTTLLVAVCAIATYERLLG